MQFMCNFRFRYVQLAIFIFDDQKLHKFFGTAILYSRDDIQLAGLILAQLPSETANPNSEISCLCGRTESSCLARLILK
jgi:hypothetical protein